MDQRNLILAIAASVAILLVFELLVSGPQREAMREQQAQQQAAQQTESGEAVPSADGGGEGALIDQGVEVPEMSREDALGGVRRVPVETPTLSGSISLQGGRLDDLTLTRYHETIDPSSPEIVLFSPNGAPKPYFANFGWISSEEIETPGPETVWRAEGEALAPGSPVTLRWDNGQGLTFERVFAVDEQYMFTVTQRVSNASGQSVTLTPYGLISRTGKPEVSRFFILHEGLIGVFNETLEEVDYDDLEDEGERVQNYESTGGWLGITDKYWMAALVPMPDEPIKARMLHIPEGDKYQTDLRYNGVPVAAGASAEHVTRLFAGAKVVKLLDQYEEDYGIANFDLAVDFGWFYFLTKPIFYAIHWLHSVLGNFGVAILVLTVGIKIIFFPLANKSYKSMAKMRKVQPEMLKLRERFADDKQRLNQEMMALYKKEGANPLSGCLPILVQIPVFFALYKVLFVTIEMRHAPFFGWIQDLSAPDPTTVLNLFGLLPFAAPELGPLDILNLGIWPLLMGASMYLQQKINPQPADPMQAKIFLMMPIVFTFLLSTFPAGLVVYWTWNNTLSIAQQWVIMRRHGVSVTKTEEKQTGPDPKAGTHAKRKAKAKAAADEKDGDEKDAESAEAENGAESSDSSSSSGQQSAGTVKSAAKPKQRSGSRSRKGRKNRKK
jgi:YidC/Oxa1 family membrane protein insertase